MNAASVLVLLAVALGVLLALRAVLRGRGGCRGCQGDCSACSRRDAGR